MLVAACGGSSTRHDESGPSSSGGEPGECIEPTSELPDPGDFQAPELDSLGSYQVTFRNRCAQTVWPAWSSAGGLDNSVIDTQLWVALPPGDDRTITVYGGVREVGFWGRTGCSFDASGRGTCQSGDCGDFICSTRVNQFPKNATMFVLTQGFLGSYNLPLSVEGMACGKRECAADLSTCSPTSTVRDSCERTIACGDICETPDQCCSELGSGCDAEFFDTGSASSGDLVFTFCP